MDDLPACFQRWALHTLWGILSRLLSLFSLSRLAALLLRLLLFRSALRSTLKLPRS
jgi:hypothetical protein